MFFSRGQTLPPVQKCQTKWWLFTGPLSIGQGSGTGCISHSHDTMTAGDFVHSCSFIFTFYIILIIKSLLPKYFTVFKYHTCIKTPQNNSFCTFLLLLLLLFFFLFFFFYNLQLHKQTICNILANKMEHNNMLNEVHLCFKVIYKNT